MRNILRNILVVAAVCVLPLTFYARTGGMAVPPPPPSDDKDSLVRLLSADSLQLMDIDGVSYRRVIGRPARFFHNNTYLLCDTALWNVDEQIINAYGSVKIIQDRTELKSDRLNYFVDRDLAEFRGSIVELSDKDHNTLRTRFLDYNTKDSVAVFRNGASMRDKDGQIIESMSGTYDSKIKTFVFNEDVNMYTDSVFVKTTWLKYESDHSLATFGYNTHAWKEGDMLSANAGTYDRSIEKFFFNKDVHVMSETQEGWCDSLYFYRATMDVTMLGNAQVTDTTRSSHALAGRIDYVDSLSLVTLTRKPAVVVEVDDETEGKDSVWFGADIMRYWTLRRCDVDSLDNVLAAERLKSIDVDPVSELRRQTAEAAAKAAEEAAANDPNNPENAAKRKADYEKSRKGPGVAPGEGPGGGEGMTGGQGQSSGTSKPKIEKPARKKFDKPSVADSTATHSDSTALAEATDSSVFSSPISDNADNESIHDDNNLSAEEEEIQDTSVSEDSSVSTESSTSSETSAESSVSEDSSASSESSDRDSDSDDASVNKRGKEISSSIKTGMRSKSDTLRGGSDEESQSGIKFGEGQIDNEDGNDSEESNGDEGGAEENRKEVTDSLAASLDTSSVGFLSARGKVKIYRRNMQVICDSLRYCDLDSLARLYIEPKIWNEENHQYIADSVYIVIRNSAMEKANLMSNAFVHIQEDTLHYDQIRSTEMVAYFDSDNHIKRFDALGGALAVFYIEENDALATVNKKDAKMLSASFKDGAIERIHYFQEVKSDAYPVVQMSREEQTIKGFAWTPEQRPKSRYDITALTFRSGQRKRYEAVPEAKFYQTDIYFPGYMASVHRQMEVRDSLKAVRERQRELDRKLAEQQALLEKQAASDSLSTTSDSLAVRDSLGVQAFRDRMSDKSGEERSVHSLADSLSTRRDSLSMHNDSLSVRGDSLSVKRDSLSAADSTSAVLGDNELQQQQKDSLKRAKLEEKQAKQAAKAEKKRLRDEAREARWEERDQKAAIRQARRDGKKLEALRRKKARALRSEQQEKSREDAVLDRYLLKMQKAKAREEAKAQKKESKTN